MTAPSKPWESNLRNNNSSSFIHSSDIHSSSGSPLDGLPGARMVRMVPGIPPLPPRQGRGLAHHSRYPFGGYGTYGYGYGGSYGFGGYGGAYGGLYGGMRGHEFENRYVQMAEESAAPAFESIESFVRGFSSVTMMLESTYQAMHMSFRAILGVAENMSRMRMAIFEFLSALTVFRTIYYFYRRILQFLGLVNNVDATWREAERAVSTGQLTTSAVRSSPKWPMLAFLGAIIAGPALVYKYLLPNGVPVEDDEIELIACYDFEAEQPGELSFSKGDHLVCKRSHIRKGWILARKNNSKGYIPYNRVKMVTRNSIASSIEQETKKNQCQPVGPVPRPVVVNPQPTQAEGHQWAVHRASSEPRSSQSGQHQDSPSNAAPISRDIPIIQPVPATVNPVSATPQQPSQAPLLPVRPILSQDSHPVDYSCNISETPCR